MGRSNVIMGKNRKRMDRSNEVMGEVRWGMGTEE